MHPSGDEAGRRLFERLGQHDVSWIADPDPDAVVDVARAWLQHNVALYLNQRGIRARQISEAVGQSQQAWRNKLNGQRAIQLDDILSIALALDPEVLNQLPRAVDTLAELLPSTLRPLLSNTTPSGRLPTFRRLPDDLWSKSAAVVCGWWSQEVAVGRSWTLSANVLLNAIMRSLGDNGLPSAGASPTRTDGEAEWVLPAARVRVAWLDPFATQHDVEAVRAELEQIAGLFWADATNVETSLIAIAAPRVTLRALRDITSLAAVDVGDAVVLSLREADALGVRAVDLHLRDVEVRRLDPDPSHPCLTIVQVK